MADRRSKPGRPTGSGSSTQRGSSRQQFQSRFENMMSQQPSESSASSRLVVILGLFLLLALMLVVRLVYLQVVASAQYSEAAQDSRTVEIELSARRGTIYDRNGNVLACSVDATTIYAVPYEISDPQGTAVILAAMLGKDAKDLEELLSDTSTSFCYVSRKEKTDVAQKVEDLGLDGIYFLEDSRREYPYGEVGGTVIGFTNYDDEGVSGLEKQYDSILSGVDGVERVELGVNQVPITGGTHDSTPAVDGQDIMVSLDIEMQSQVESTCKAWAESLGVETQAVLMDGETGEIYAAASTPLLDPSNIKDIKEGATELLPVSSPYEPGSIFKTVTALTALENHAVAVEDTFDCPSYLEADGYTVSDSHARGDITYSLREIIQYSSNVGISLVAEKVGFEKLYNKIIEYGLNEKTGVDYPGEASGYLSDYEDWSLIQSYNISFGQGVSVTPMQMTRLYGAIVNNGVAVTPHFLIAYPQTGEKPSYSSKEIIHNESTCTDMTSMLESVVEDGTAKAAQIEGYTPAGKTGTAEIADANGGYQNGVYNISFTGFLANSTSKLVCFTGAVAQPAEGNVSGMFREIMSYAIDRYKITQK